MSSQRNMMAERVNCRSGRLPLDPYSNGESSHRSQVDTRELVGWWVH